MPFPLSHTVRAIFTTYVAVKQRIGGWLLHRRHLEACVFSCIATELKSGDICVPDSESYADYREQLLPWEECEPLIPAYCQELGFLGNVVNFVKGLKSWMTQVFQKIDNEFPENEHVSINEAGKLILGVSGSVEQDLGISLIGHCKNMHHI